MSANRAPYATLFGLPFGNTEGIADGSIVAFGIPVQSASPRRPGTALGPAAIRETSGDALHAYHESPSGTVVDLATGLAKKLRVPDGSLDLGDLEFDGQISMGDIDHIRDLTGAIAARGGLPVALGGDHRAFEGVIRGLEPGPDVPAVISISDKLSLPAALDAPPLPLGALVSRGADRPSPLLCIGVNGLQSGAGWQAFQQIGGEMITADDLYDSRAESLETINRFIGRHSSLAICLDLEVIDAGYAAGTPAVNVGGLMPEQLLDLLNEIDHPASLAAVAVTNVAPRLDARGLTELAATEGLLALLDRHLFEEISQ